MSQPLTVALPPGFELAGGYTITLAAVDATTGADVAGVTVSNVMLEVDTTHGSSEVLPPVLLLYKDRG